jgi:hypothetical protein
MLNNEKPYPKKPVEPGGPEEGKRLRDQAVESVEAAHEEWVAYAGIALYQLCQEREEFTSEDLWLRLDRADIEEPRAMGAVFSNARRAKMCERTDRVTEAKRSTRHRGSVRIWRSLIFVKQPRLPGVS